MQIAEGIKKVAVLCILQHQDSFLLLKRLKPPNQGMFTPVGGKLDPHESPLQAALRETREETGIVLPHMHYCGTLVETSPAPYNWISFVFSAEIEYQDPPPCPEGTLLWIDCNQLLEVPTPATDWFIYKYLLEKRKFHFDAQFDAGIQLLLMREELENTVVFDAAHSSGINLMQGIQP